MSIVYRREDEKHRQVTRPRILRFLVRLVQGTSFWWNESSESNSYPKVKSFQSKPKEAGQEESLWWQFGDTSRCFNGWHFASWVRNLRKDSQWGGSLTECLSDIRLSTVYNVSPFSFFFFTNAIRGPCTTVTARNCNRFTSKLFGPYMEFTLQDRIARLEILHRADSTSAYSRPIKTQVRWTKSIDLPIGRFTFLPGLLYRSRVLSIVFYLGLAYRLFLVTRYALLVWFPCLGWNDYFECYMEAS